MRLYQVRCLSDEDVDKLLDFFDLEEFVDKVTASASVSGTVVTITVVDRDEYNERD